MTLIEFLIEAKWWIASILLCGIGFILAMYLEGER